MEREVTFKEADMAYRLGKWVTIGEAPDNGWSVNKVFEDGKTLQYIAQRYRLYYAGAVRYWIKG